MAQAIDLGGNDLVVNSIRAGYSSSGVSATKTATATAGAVTLNTTQGVITSESLTTAAGATYTLTLTNSTIAATDVVMADVALGSSTQGMPTITTVKPGAGSVVITVQNIHGTLALNGTIVVSFVVFKN